ncbi:MAG: ethanolamine ammonia-lyase subunit EutC [Rhodoferax sp.]|uniref:ethanolamine ammonia-lyase subunit EutC n=1 Tax=Rhodoferax sp. TaxID=50421 RepID=UPI0026320718|nr:ethanolamine ammonia-lyase subunit EutC [Rhodoferax sp.]MDD2880552.1 ethanolamine ammonia-lyase subunit EutC [Rhodoferax sp.]
MSHLITPTPWDALRQFTDARIALGRAGVSVPTRAHLAFQLAHAQARDAVHLPLDATGMAASLQMLGLPTLMLHSQAADRATYLQRPDLGRRLNAASLQTLAQWQAAPRNEGGLLHSAGSPTHHAADAAFDLAFVVVDGLSALAIHQNALPLVANMLKRLQNDPAQTWRIAPLTVVEQGRVAIGDEVGEQLNAQLVVMLIGERPGLSSPDSMGLYLTWSPRVGRSDAERNCISNVRDAGLSVEAAALTLHRLLTQARIKQLSGVGLKDDVDDRLHRKGIVTDELAQGL